MSSEDEENAQSIVETIHRGVRPSKIALIGQKAMHQLNNKTRNIQLMLLPLPFNADSIDEFTFI